MKIKISWNLVGMLYFVILAFYLISSFLTGAYTKNANILEYLLFAPLLTLTVALGIVLVVYICYVTIRDNK